MKKFLGAVLIVGLAVLLVWQGMTITNLDKKNAVLEQGMAAASSNITGLVTEFESLKSASEGLRNELYEDQRELQRELASARKELGETQGTLTFLDGKLRATEELAAKQRELEGKVSGLAKLENEIFQPAEVYKKVRQSVVRVGYGESAAAGFVFMEKNLVVTAYHVVKGANPGAMVSVLANDGYFWMIGRVKMVKPEWDIAVIETVEPLMAKPLLPADVKKFSVGEPVVVVGDPAGFYNSASTGVLSGISRKMEKLPAVYFLQVDASVYQGSSGGPVFNGRGEVMGFVSYSIKDAFTFSFVVPINYVNKLLE